MRKTEKSKVMGIQEEDCRINRTIKENRILVIRKSIEYDAFSYGISLIN
jgi:hypothetical protein